MESVVSFLTSKHVNVDTFDLFETTISALQKLNKTRKGKTKSFQLPANTKTDILHFYC